MPAGIHSFRAPSTRERKSRGLLNFPRKWTSTLYGYKADKTSNTCPIFVTLHKSDEVSASTAYEDALLDRSTMLWYTKSNRTLQSPLEKAIAAGEYRLPVFVKKDDAEGSEFYYWLRKSRRCRGHHDARQRRRSRQSRTNAPAV